VCLGGGGIWFDSNAESNFIETPLCVQIIDSFQAESSLLLSLLLPLPTAKEGGGYLNRYELRGRTERDFAGKVFLLFEPRIGQLSSKIFIPGIIASHMRLEKKTAWIRPARLVI